MNSVLIKTINLLILLGCFIYCDNNQNKGNGNGEPVGILGGQYFVSPDGADTNPGTLEEPWKSWTKAFKTAQAGDTVYFRGGIYISTSGNGGERDFNSGTELNPICFFNYPGETPILECKNRDVTSLGYNKGIAIWDVQNVHIKGLQIRNLYQRLNSHVVGIEAHKVGDVTFENITISNVAGQAFVVADYHSTITYINCDAYNMCDTLQSAVYPTPGSPGQNGTGFHYKTLQETVGAEASRLFYFGCRTWEFSDNGFAGISVGYVEMDHCWAFDGGRFEGEGCGFKYASSFGNTNTLPLARVMKYCFGANNGGYGFSPNNAGYAPLVGLYYNNSAYYNGFKEGIGHGLGYGWIIMQTNSSEAPKGELYANNLAYKNKKADAFAVRGQAFNQQNNSWNLPLVITDHDFVSLDWTELKRPRKKDGSLPDINFLKPRSGSLLVDAGIDVGLPYLGVSPDLGAFEIE